jgi:hypothetical protein
MKPSSTATDQCPYGVSQKPPAVWSGIPRATATPAGRFVPEQFLDLQVMLDGLVQSLSAASGSLTPDVCAHLVRASQDRLDLAIQVAGDGKAAFGIDQDGAQVAFNAL